VEVVHASSITSNPPAAITVPLGKVNDGPKKLLSIRPHPDRSTAAAVGLMNSSHPAGDSALGWTSLMRMAGAVATVMVRSPTLPSTVAVMRVVPGAIPRMNPELGFTGAIVG
jgi:hypothetical protein